MIEELVRKLESYLRAQSLEGRGGQNIDAMLVPVLRQRNSREGNKYFKENRMLVGWD